MAWETVKSHRRGAVPVSNEDGIVLTTVWGNRRKNQRALCIRIGQQVASEYRLQVGDMVQVDFDFEGRLGRIRRTPDGQFKVSPNGGKTEDQKGKIMTCLVKFSDRDGILGKVMPEHVRRYVAPSVECLDEGIVFELYREDS